LNVSKKRSSPEISTLIDKFSARIISDLPGFITSEKATALPPVTYAYDVIYFQIYTRELAEKFPGGPTEIRPKYSTIKPPLDQKGV